MLVACSGTADLEGDPLTEPAQQTQNDTAEPDNADHDTATATPPPKGYVAPPAGTRTALMQGDTQDPRAQRRKFLINENLKRARRAAKLNLWADVRQAAAAVLELDGSNEEARRLLQRAAGLLGEREPGVQEEARRAHIQGEIEKQRDLFRARDFERQGDFLMAQSKKAKSDFEKAEQAYERARLTLTYSPWFTPGGEDQRRIEAKIKRTQTDFKTWIAQKVEADQRATREALLDSERKAKERRDRRVSELFLQANLAFQEGQYGRTVTQLDEALKVDPLHQQAKDLRELAMRARHDQNLDKIKRDWARNWAQTFHDLEASDVTQVDPIQHDVEYWNTVVNGRKPLEFSHFDIVEDPESAEILKVLESTVVKHDFPETPLDAWVEFYRRASGLTFAVSPKVAELDEAETTLSKFSIGKKSIKSALDLIARIRPIKWKVKDGVVQILTKEEGAGAVTLRMYDVREIINPLAQHAGRDILLKVGDSFDEGFDEGEEPLPVVVDIDKLQELIRANVEAASWDSEGVSINAIGSTLAINQTAEVHAKIDRLLRDLRGTSGIQVDIEARFLRVEDNFLEEVGVDFRGLGNQASEGVGGRGLEKQGPRDGFGFDDFGRNTSAGDPTEVGSGFEPGIFYNDGGDGDLFGRTENLFDRVLGGGEEGLSNAGGLSFQYAYLDDTELEVILRAVQKQERVEEITAPRLLVHNTARANLAVNRQFSYIRDFNVEIAQAAAVADPVVDVIRDGIVLDVRPVVAADRKYILMELRPTVAQLALPIPTFTTSLGVGQPISIQVPRLTLQKVRTTVVMPDGGTLLLGGMKNVQKQQFNSGVPILKDLPGLSFLFSRKGTYRANKKILILLRASVVIPSEWEPTIDASSR